MKYAIQDTMFFVAGMLIVSAITQTFDLRHMVLFAAYFFALDVGMTIGKWVYRRTHY